MDIIKRCDWCNGSAAYQAYHDQEWGVPVHDDRTLFEYLILEGAQAGLSWSTILNKRDNYRRLFDHFDIATVAAYDDARQAALLQDAGIVRNRQKVAAAVINAQASLRVQDEFGSLDAYLWRFVGGEPIQNRWADRSEVPAKTAESDVMSRELQKRGFKFVGSTICYAFMQATGMVNDHPVGCFRHEQVRALSRQADHKEKK